MPAAIRRAIVLMVFIAAAVPVNQLVFAQPPQGPPRDSTLSSMQPPPPQAPPPNETVQRRDSLQVKPAAPVIVRADSSRTARSDTVQQKLVLPAKELEDSTKRACLDIDESELPRGATDTTTLNLKDTDLRDIYRALAYKYGVNIFLDNSVVKRVTISLTKVRVYDAIRFLAEQNGLTVHFHGGIFTIQPPPPPPRKEPPPPHMPYVAFENSRLSVEFQNDDIAAVVAEIQRKTSKNILTISGTTGTLTGKLIAIDFDLGFNQIMNNNGFAVQKKNDIYIISRLEYFVGTQGQSSPQKTGPYWVSVKDSLVSIDVTNAPLNRLLPDIIRQLNTDVVFYNDLTGTVTARTTSTPLPEVLTLLLRNTAYTYRESHGIYYIGDKTNKTLQGATLYKLKYLSAEQSLDMIPQAITSQATVKVSKEHNGFVVVGPQDIKDQLQDFLSEIDKPVAQVLIEALVVDYDISHGSDFGIEAGLSATSDTTGYNRSGTLYPSVDMTFNGTAVNNMLKKAKSISLFGKEINLEKLASLPSDFYLNLKAQEEKGTANVRSHPILATLNGHKATLSVGKTQYYLLTTSTPYVSSTSTVVQTTQSFQTVEADIKLEITPYVGANGMITLEIKPDFRSPVGTLSSSTPPTITKRSMSSTIIMREGETIVLGGLVQESTSETSTQVPLIGSIPLLGKLFSSTSDSKEKTELLIYVTPHISYGEAFQGEFGKPGDE